MDSSGVPIPDSMENGTTTIYIPKTACCKLADRVEIISPIPMDAHRKDASKASRSPKELLSGTRNQNNAASKPTVSWHTPAMSVENPFAKSNSKEEYGVMRSWSNVPASRS